MRILQATITYPPAIGGLDQYVQECSEGLHRRGHKVTVFTTDLEQPMSRRRLAAAEIKPSNVHVHRFHASRLPGVGFPFALRMRRQMCETEADLIHAHCVWHSPALIAWQVSRKRHLPFVLNTIFSPRSSRLWRIYLNQVRHMIADCACIITISDFERRLLVEAGLHSKKVEIIPPTVDLSVFERSHPSVLDRYGLRDHPVIVSVGRLAAGKRVDRLIQAFPQVLQKHPEARLLIVGPDYGDEPRLKQLASSMRLAPLIVFAGAIQRDQLPAIMQSATVFAMTTDFELFGIVLIEAMAAGTAIVAPRSTAVSEVVSDGETGLLYDSDDVKDLAAKLNMLLSEVDLRKSLVEAARSVVHSRFDFETNLDRVEWLYASVCQ